MFFLLILIVVLYFIFRPSKKGVNTSNSSMPDFSEYDKGWVTFIKSYSKVVKTKSEKALIERMLADLKEQGYKDDDIQALSMQNSAQPTSNTYATNVTTQYAVNDVPTYAEVPPRKTKAQIQLDNASLLLYFGAFLLVASAGLFVAFGGLDGTLRTLVVLLVAFVMYSGGMWISDNRTRFKQAGLAFVGIGMAIAPLIGLAAYTYIFDKQNGPAVWLGTSVLCLGMYTHALMKLRNPLLNYLLIFTFVSLFEASIAVIDMPLYYFGWGLAIIGLSLSIIARRKGVWEDFRESSSTSGMFFLPLSLIGSMSLIGQHGIMQFGVSLLLATAYYTLQAIDTKYDEQYANATVAQVTGLAGLAIIYYGFSKNWAGTSLVLATVNFMQLLIIIKMSAESILVRNFASIMLVSSALAAVVGWQSKSLVIAMLAMFVITAAAVSYKQKRTEVYALAALGFTALPLVYAQYFKSPSLPADKTVVLLLAASLVQFGVLLLGKKTLKYILDGTAQYTYLMTSCLVIVASFFAGPWLTCAVAFAAGFTYILLGLMYEGHDWGTAAGLVVCVPLLWGSQSKGMLLTTVIGALLINIFVSLKSRSEANRWVSTGLWLLLPVAFGIKWGWGNVAYSWAYLVAMAGLIFSRSIARGVVFVSSKIPLASYAKNTSYSYEYGYWLAAAISVLVSLSTDASRLQTTVILAIMSFVVLFLSFVIEKRSDLLVLLPLLVQGVLLSALRPVSDIAVQTYLLASTSLAIASYLLVSGGIDTKQSKAYAVRLGALASLWITPVSYFFVGKSLLVMPFGLLAGSIIYAYHLRKELQSSRELAYSGVAASALWLLSYYGVTEPQAYVHVFILLFAVFAYWRHVRGETEQSDQYIYAMLISATLPLAMQAMQTNAGGLYGWWLLLEQVGFIVIGMSIGKKIVTTWGLYAAVGAVLFQLRGLGWAALTVLALFLIGLAVYKIQKNADK